MTGRTILTGRTFTIEEEIRFRVRKSGEAPFTVSETVTLAKIKGWYWALLYRVTTLLPVALLAAVISFLLLAKLLLTIARWLAMHYLEVATEKDPGSPGAQFVPVTVLGGAVALLIMGLKLLVTAVLTVRAT